MPFIRDSLSLISDASYLRRVLFPRSKGPIKQNNFSVGKSDGVEGAKNGRGSGEKSVKEKER